MPKKCRLRTLLQVRAEERVSRYSVLPYLAEGTKRGIPLPYPEGKSANALCEETNRSFRPCPYVTLKTRCQSIQDLPRTIEVRGTTPSICTGHSMLCPYGIFF